MDDNFDPPPRGLSALAVVGGIATALAAIMGLQSLADSLEASSRPPAMQSPVMASPTMQPASAPTTAPEKSPVTVDKTINKITTSDTQSMQLPGTPIDLKTPATKVTIPPWDNTSLEIAQYAWRYFKTNINPDTGLVNSADGFPAVTLWDQAAGLAAIVAARELNLISPAEFETTTGKTLDTLAKLKLYNGELPNKVYNSRTLKPVNYGVLDVSEEIGWSAIDLGRMALWLKIIGEKYPTLKPKTIAVWNSWDVKRLVQKGELYGSSRENGQESYHQEGRLGYESYAAYGLSLWGLKVSKALDIQHNLKFVNLYGVSVPYDQRDYKTTTAHNYVLSEPYFLDGIETGFQSLPKRYADNILAAQEARFKATGQLTALTEDNLDRSPYFLYNTLFVNGTPWAAINDRGENYNNLRFLSTKAAFCWHVLYNTRYTQQLHQFVLSHLRTDGGWYGGYYEALQQPNASLTANNNGVILECSLFQKVGQPLTTWAGLK